MSRLIKYKSIPRDLYQKLELLATKIRLVKITYKTEQGLKEVEGFIQNLYAKDKREYLLLSDGMEIRLDLIDRVED